MTIPQDAVESAKEAMREVTPPPGASKADWLAEHGGFALIAGAIAAAAPHIQAQALRDAADELTKLQYVRPLDAGRPEYEAMLAIRRGNTDAWLRARANTINPEAKDPR